MEPETLPTAPKSFDPQLADAILRQARHESRTVQAVFLWALLDMASPWVIDMMGKQRSLGMLPIDIQDYIEGYSLPIIALQVGRIGVNYGIDHAINEVENAPDSYLNTVIKSNLNLIIGSLTFEDPSGLTLFTSLRRQYDNFPGKFLIRGMQYSYEIFVKYWEYFARSGYSVDLW